MVEWSTIFHSENERKLPILPKFVPKRLFRSCVTFWQISGRLFIFVVVYEKKVCLVQMSLRLECEIHFSTFIIVNWRYQSFELIFNPWASFSAFLDREKKTLWYRGWESVCNNLLNYSRHYLKGRNYWRKKAVIFIFSIRQYKFHQIIFFLPFTKLNSAKLSKFSFRVQYKVFPEFRFIKWLTSAKYNFYPPAISSLPSSGQNEKKTGGLKYMFY